MEEMKGRGRADAKRWWLSGMETERPGEAAVEMSLHKDAG